MMSEDDALAALRETVARHDPVPPWVLDAAKASLSWRDPDAELARLTADSAGERLIAVRGGGSPRLLSFLGGSVTIDLETTVRGGAVEVLGEVSPAAPARVVLESVTGFTRATETGAAGRFQFDGVPVGAFRLRCEATGAGGAALAVHTEWIML